MGIEFKNPYMLLLFVPYAGFAFLMLRGYFRKREATILSSTVSHARKRKTVRSLLVKVPDFLRLAAMALLIVAIARPGKGIDSTSVTKYGIDIMIALDVSPSMRGEDYDPNRLAVAKQALLEFVKKRPNDRIGLVAFSGDAYLQCPLTLEHDMVNDIVNDIDFDSVSEDGTAIGDALLLSGSQMKDVSTNGKVVLLLTDGVSNRGVIDPKTAAAACAKLGIKVYVVGIGHEGTVPITRGSGVFAVTQNLVNEFDEKTMRAITAATGGVFFRAEKQKELFKDLSSVDILEKHKFDIREYHEYFDRYQIPLFMAMIFFFCEILMRAFVLRKLP